MQPKQKEQIKEGSTSVSFGRDNGKYENENER